MAPKVMIGADLARSRVQRLLSGQFRVDDLTKLYLWCRNHCHGRATVAEVGHCLAHPNVRDRGPITKALLLFLQNCQFAKFVASKSSLKALSIEDLPPSTLSIAPHNIESIPEETIIRQTGLKRHEARQCLSKMIPKLTLRPDQTLQACSPLSEKERRVLGCALGSFVVKPFCTSGDIWGEFLDVLQINDILANHERHDVERVRPSLLLFVACTLHRLRIQMDDGIHAWLTIQTINKEITVVATVPMNIDEGCIYLVFTLFRTQLTVREVCETELGLTEEDRWPHLHIELLDDQKLHRIRGN